MAPGPEPGRGRQERQRRGKLTRIVQVSGQEDERLWIFGLSFVSREGLENGPIRVSLDSSPLREKKCNPDRVFGTTGLEPGKPLSIPLLEPGHGVEQRDIVATHVTHPTLEKGPCPVGFFPKDQGLGREENWLLAMGSHAGGVSQIIEGLPDATVREEEPSPRDPGSGVVACRGDELIQIAQESRGLLAPHPGTHPGKSSKNPDAQIALLLGKLRGAHEMSLSLL